MDMTLDEARELLVSPMWASVRDHFLAGNPFDVYPAGDLRRLEYLDDGARDAISRWCEGAARVSEWKKVISGKEVRVLRESHPDVYPEILRYETYFSKCTDDESRLRMVLKLKFPSAFELVSR